MRIITPSVEIIDQPSGLSGIYQMIELASRTCYKSENKITETSAQEFVNRMIESKHLAMLEHGTVYLQYNHNSLHPYKGSDLYEKYKSNKYSECHYDYVNRDTKATIITTNYRVLFENGWLNDLEYLCEPTNFHEKRVSAKFSTQIIITREVHRHRTHSMAGESTRYCKYTSDKFGNEIAISCPTWVNLQTFPEIAKENEDFCFRSLCDSIAQKEDQDNFKDIDYWWFANKACEYAYFNLLRLGRNVDEARVVLPIDNKSEIIHTAFISDWIHFFDLRVKGTTGTPHPDIKILAEPLMNEFISRGLLVK